jgi:hypothetical protein
MTTLDASPWICMDCSARNAAGGDCGSCGQGPLLDVRDAQVRATLLQQDAERGLKRGRTLIVVAAGVAAVLGFPLVFVLGQFVGLAAVVGLGALVYAGLRMALPYKPRFADLRA